MPEYAWAESDARSRRRVAAAAVQLDPGSFDHLERLGVGEGWKCAEVGAGVGTVAAWLCERVGSAGRVLATDLDTRWMADLESRGVEIRVQDISMEPPGDGEFDLVHARMVLTHLHDGERAVANMVRAVRAGGWLLLEEPEQSLLMGRCIPEEPAALRFAQGLRVLTEKGGGDANFGVRLTALFREHGLREVEVHPRLPEMTVEVLVSAMESAGDLMLSMGLLEPGDLERIATYIDDPSNLIFGPLVIAASGRKPV